MKILGGIFRTQKSRIFDVVKIEKRKKVKLKRKIYLIQLPKVDELLY